LLTFNQAYAIILVMSEHFSDVPPIQTPEQTAESYVHAFAGALAAQSRRVLDDPTAPGVATAVMGFVQGNADILPNDQATELYGGALDLQNAESGAHQRDYNSAHFVMARLDEGGTALAQVIRLIRDGETNGNPITATSIADLLESEEVYGNLVRASLAHEEQSARVFAKEQSMVGADGSIPIPYRTLPTRLSNRG
jgi:hypothetical protein